MTKFSQLPQDPAASVSAADFLAGYVASGPTTARFKISDILALAVASGFNPYKAGVYRNAAQNSGNAAYGLVTFDTKEFDTGTNYNVSTGLFTAPIAGFYQVSWAICFQANSSVNIASLFKNGAEFKRGGRMKISADNTCCTGSALVKLAATDTLSIEAFGSSAIALEVGGGGALCYMTVGLFSAT